jgi:hypothetical protein
MTIEDPEEYPENYFTDLDSSHANFNDIMLATDFGVIDTPAGEPFNPDEAATREFAAHTLNYCLGYQLDEDVQYTFSEGESETYASDLQVALNRDWFSLVGGNVNSYLDHRIAMTAAVGLIASQKGGEIQKEECCAISFPDFFQKLGVK